MMWMPPFLLHLSRFSETLATNITWITVSTTLVTKLS